MSLGYVGVQVNPNADEHLINSESTVDKRKVTHYLFTWIPVGGYHEIFLSFIREGGFQFLQGRK